MRGVALFTAGVCWFAVRGLPVADNCDEKCTQTEADKRADCITTCIQDNPKPYPPPRGGTTGVPPAIAPPAKPMFDYKALIRPFGNSNSFLPTRTGKCSC